MYADLMKRVIIQFKTICVDTIPDSILRKNRKFKDRHKGERCFILGSGNSIMEQDLTRLSDEIVMTQNHFHAHKDINIIKPKYHIVVPKYQPKEYDNDWITWLKSMDEKLPKETVFFMGKNTKYLVDDLSLFNDRAYYIKAGYECALIRNAPVDITRTIMSIPTVLLQCLAIAIYMGFREIILLGFDLDQICRLSDRSKVRFYGFSPITANKAEETAEESYMASENVWINRWIIWRQCNLLRREAEKEDIGIINATRGGLLNMFERRNYEDLLR